ncbi:MAG: TolC family protein, partial [Candidatus Omnitrophota bacterium]
RQVEREDLNLKLAKRERLPKTTFSLWGEKDSADTHFGGGMNLEIPLWYRKKGEISEAKALKSKALIEQEFLTHQVDREVRDAFQELTKTARSLEAEQEGISWSAELIRTTFQAYQEGTAPFLQFLETLTPVNQFKQDYFASLAAWHIGKAALEKAIGATE